MDIIDQFEVNLSTRLKKVDLHRAISTDSLADLESW